MSDGRDGASDSGAIQSTDIVMHPDSIVDPLPRGTKELILRCQQSFLRIFELIEIDRTESELLLPELIKLIRVLIEISALGFCSDYHEKLPFWIDKLNLVPPAGKLSKDETLDLKGDLHCGYEELQSVIIRLPP